MTTSTDIQLPFTEKFAEQWESWLSYRKDIKKPYKSEKSIEGVLKKLTYYTEETACKMIQNSIDNGYQGIFEIKEENGKTVSTKEVYIPHDNSPNILKDFKARAFNRNEWREMVKQKIERFNTTGEYTINDYGNVIYEHFIKRGILKLPNEIKEQIRGELTFEATRKRTRFEEQYNGSLESDIKRAELREFLTICRKDKRDILKELKTNQD